MYQNSKKVSKKPTSTRKRQSAAQNFEFGSLEPRQLMAADLIASGAPQIESLSFEQVQIETFATQSFASKPAISIATASNSTGLVAPQKLETAGLEQNADQFRTNFSGTDFAEAVKAQPDGKIVVAGGGGADFAVARYNEDGTLDQNFGEGGKIRVNFGGVDSARDLVIQEDGKILVVGAANNQQDFGLLRLNANGSVDTSFGSDGKVTTNFSGTDFAEAVEIQRDGKIVVVGGGGDDFGIARYNQNGTLDQSFGEGGKTRVNFSGVDNARDLIIQGDGKILVVGAAKSQADFGLVRLNANGSVDSSFGTDGKVTTNFSGTDFAEAVAILRDGSITVVGGGGADFGLALYNKDGGIYTGPTDDTPPGDTGSKNNPGSTIVIVGPTITIGEDDQDDDTNSPPATSDDSTDQLPSWLTIDANELDHLIITGIVGRGANVSISRGGDSLIRVNYEGEGNFIVPNSGSIKKLTFRGTSLSDKFENNTNIPSTVYAGAGDDVIRGGSAGEYIDGGAGNDKIYGRGGNDTLVGQVGDDVIYGGKGADTVQGGAGHDRIYGGDGADTLNGNGGNDSIDGGAGSDHLFGHLGNDRLEGGKGADHLHGNQGDDHLLGGAGQDVLNGHEGNDLLEGGDGRDHLYGHEGRDRLFGGYGDDYLDGGLGSDEVRGGRGVDTLIVDSVFDSWFGGKGKDKYWVDGKLQKSRK